MKIKKKQTAVFYHRFDVGEGRGIIGQCSFDLAGGKPVTGICRIWGKPELLHPMEWHLWGKHISEVLKTKPNTLAKIMIATDLADEKR